MAAQADKLLVALLSEREYEILRVLLWEPERSGRQIAETLQCSPSTATNWLARLQEAGLVMSEPAGRSGGWSLNREHWFVALWLAEMGN